MLFIHLQTSLEVITITNNGWKDIFFNQSCNSIFAFLINILAAIAIWKKRPLKSFQIILLHIVFCNAIYALNIMSSSVLFFTYLDLLLSKKYSIFRNLIRIVCYLNFLFHSVYDLAAFNSSSETTEVCKLCYHC